LKIQSDFNLRIKSSKIQSLILSFRIESLRLEDLIRRLNQTSNFFRKFILYFQILKNFLEEHSKIIRRALED